MVPKFPMVLESQAIKVENTNLYTKKLGVFLRLLQGRVDPRTCSGVSSRDIRKKPFENSKFLQSPVHNIEYNEAPLLAAALTEAPRKKPKTKNFDLKISLLILSILKKGNGIL